jgi:hypothetical protein
MQKSKLLPQVNNCFGINPICLLMLPSSRDKKFPELRVAANRLDCQSPNYMGIGIWNGSKDFERETYNIPYILSIICTYAFKIQALF